MARLKKTLSPPFTCPSFVLREKGHAILTQHALRRPSSQRPWIPHHLSYVIIRLMEANGLNASWRTYYPCNALLRDTSPAWCTQARIWVKITSDPFNCWQESNVNKIIEFKAVQNKKDQYAWNAASCHLWPAAWRCDRREKLTFISSAVCSPM